jgi:hypothetical protein
MVRSEVMDFRWIVMSRRMLLKSQGSSEKARGLEWQVQVIRLGLGKTSRLT